jgi:hypothetical protein
VGSGFKGDFFVSLVAHCGDGYTDDGMCKQASLKCGTFSLPFVLWKVKVLPECGGLTTKQVCLNENSNKLSGDPPGDRMTEHYRRAARVG